MDHDIKYRQFADFMHLNAKDLRDTATVIMEEMPRISVATREALGEALHDFLAATDTLGTALQTMTKVNERRDGEA